MSDFTSNFWSVYVAGISLFGIVACLVLLWFSGKAKAMTANDNTTGHVWDGDLREMNNPLPRWWVWLFIITVVFALGYLVMYPGLGTHQGTFGWSAVGQYETEVAKGNKEAEPLYAKFNGMKPEEVAGDAQAVGRLRLHGAKTVDRVQTAGRRAVRVPWQVDLRALGRGVQAVKPHQRFMNFFGLKAGCNEFAPQPVNFMAGSALPVIFVNINQNFKHAFNVLQIGSA